MPLLRGLHRTVVIHPGHYPFIYKGRALPASAGLCSGRKKPAEGTFLLGAALLCRGNEKRHTTSGGGRPRRELRHIWMVEGGGHYFRYDSLVN